jgi:hypothetical protein
VTSWIQDDAEKIFFKFIHPFTNSSLAAILVGSRDHQTQFWKGAIQGLFHQSLVAIGPVVSEEKFFMWKARNRKKGGWNFLKNLLWNYWANLNQTLLKWFLGGPLPKACLAFQTSDQDGHGCGAILVEGPNRQTYFWKRIIQWLFHQHLVLIEQMVSDKKIFMGISPRVLC